MSNGIAAAEQDHMEWVADESHRFGILRTVAKDGRQVDGPDAVTVETARRVAEAKGLRLVERTV